MADAATRGAGLDWKTSLQEIASLGGHGVPVYQVTESGPDHAKTFVATVGLGDQTYGPGSGRNKKEAEQRQRRSPSPPSARRPLVGAGDRHRRRRDRRYGPADMPAENASRARAA